MQIYQCYRFNNVRRLRSQLLTYLFIEKKNIFTQIILNSDKQNYFQSEAIIYSLIINVRPKVGQLSFILC